MIKKIILLVILISILIVIWQSSNGYREICSKSKNVTKIKIYNKKLFYELYKQEKKTGEIIMSTTEAIEKSTILIVNDEEISDFLKCIHPNLFNFITLNCKCTGDYNISFEYKNGTTYSFALAHKNKMKIPKYGDWPIGNEVDLWIQNKLLSKPK